jgi:internalin A
VELRLSGTNITDLSPLSGLQSLRSLRIAYSKIKSLDPLSTLKDLEALALTGSYFTDYAPILNLSSLSLLEIDPSHRDLFPVIDSHPGISELRLRGTGWADIIDSLPVSGLNTIRFTDEKLPDDAKARLLSANPSLAIQSTAKN